MHVANRVSDLSPHGLICLLVKNIHPASYLFTSIQRVVEIAKEISKYILQYSNADTYILTHISDFQKLTDVFLANKMISSIHPAKCTVVGKHRLQLTWPDYQIPVID